MNLNPIICTSGNCCYTAHGSFVMGFRLILPEIGELNLERLQKSQEAWINLIRMLPDGTIITRFDAYTEQKFNPSVLPERTYFQRKYKAHMSERGRLENDSFVFFTWPRLKTLSTLLQNPFKGIKEKITVDEQNFINVEFQGAVNGEIKTLNTSGLVLASPLSDSELRYFNFKYFNLFDVNNSTTIDYTIKHIIDDSKLNLSIGNQYIGIFSVYDERQLPTPPAAVSSIVRDPLLSTKAHEFKTAAGDTLGIYARHPHYVTTTIIKDSLQKWIDQVHNNKMQYKRMAQFIDSYKEPFERLQKLESNMSGMYNQDTIVRANTTLIFWAEENNFTDRKDYFRSALKNTKVIAYFPSGKHAKHLFTTANPLFSAAGSELNFYPNSVGIPVAFFPTAGNYNDDPDGVWMCDRFNVPVRMDLWDKKKKYIQARNALMIAPTGSGKSVFMQELLRQFKEQDVTLIIVDIGNSFKKFARLMGDDALHIEYTPGMALGINPFNRPIEELLMPEKLESLANFVFAHMEMMVDPKQEDLNFLREVIKLYIEQQQSRLSFADFAQFIIDTQRNIRDEFEKHLKYFDFDRMLINLQLFIGDGIYAYLYKAPNTTVTFSDSLQSKKVIVFEIEKALDTPQILGVLLQTIGDTIKTNILSDVTKRGVVLFEEAAKVIKVGNMLSQIEFQYQTIRKKGGAVIMVLQSAMQIPAGQTADSIFDNTQIIFALKNDQGYDKMSDRLKIKDNHTLAQLNSLTNCFDRDAAYKYSELFIRQGLRERVVRIETSPEQLLAYATDGDDNNKLLQLLDAGEDLETSINKVLKL
ncbi:MAG: DUF87 domain-containing protein [Tannerella sp.]|nr:DUF87 domain-containing protein [Tannerella sp.]